MINTIHEHEGIDCRLQIADCRLQNLKSKIYNLKSVVDLGFDRV